MLFFKGRGLIIYCSRCGNSDPNLFGFKNGKSYCRACIKYSGRNANIKKYIKPKNRTAILNYSLSEEQEKISLDACELKEDIYIDAVCGAGKTEIIFKSIEKALSEGKRVGFAIPRREVVEDIYSRLKSVYPTLNIISVYGGHNEFLDGDIVVLTCHQCYRYKEKFGLLIIDEYDAFPLKGDNVLLNLTIKSCYGKCIYLSATFSKSFLENKKYFSLDRRYHNADIPIPKIYEGNIISRVLKLILLINQNKNNSLFVFAPTIFQAKLIKLFLNLIFIRASIFTSKTIDKTNLLNSIKDKTNKLVICTTILERGITVKGLNVIVFNSDHKLFDCPTLIQISGRVGRKKDSTKGNIWFLASKSTSEMNNCIEHIIRKNNAIK